MILGVLLTTMPTVMQAQERVQCGSIVEAEFTLERRRHSYALDLAPGDLFDIAIDPLGDTLSISLEIKGPDGRNFLTRYNDSGFAGRTLELTSPVLSGRGTYRIEPYGRSSSNIGIYTLYIGCTLRNGTIIRPGDASPSNTSEAEVASAPDTLSFSGFGFPGLAPVDFSNVARLPIPAGIPMSGAVTATGSEILGYQFDAEAGDTVELSFNRLSGNLNLGLVVIDSQSNVIYQASLVTTQSMTARFAVPTAGQYTAGIFRINLLPPSAPEPTAFQVIATVNP